MHIKAVARNLMTGRLHGSPQLVSVGSRIDHSPLQVKNSGFHEAQTDLLLLAFLVNISGPFFLSLRGPKFQTPPARAPLT